MWYNARSQLQTSLLWWCGAAIWNRSKKHMVTLNKLSGAGTIKIVRSNAVPSQLSYHRPRHPARSSVPSSSFIRNVSHSRDVDWWLCFTLCWDGDSQQIVEDREKNSTCVSLSRQMVHGSAYAFARTPTNTLHAKMISSREWLPRSTWNVRRTKQNMYQSVRKRKTKNLCTLRICNSHVYLRRWHTGPRRHSNPARRATFYTDRDFTKRSKKTQ